MLNLLSFERRSASKLSHMDLILSRWNRHVRCQHFFGYHGIIHRKQSSVEIKWSMAHKCITIPPIKLHSAWPSTVLASDDGHLFLGCVKMKSIGVFISVCCVVPHIIGSKFKCSLAFSCADAEDSGFILEFLTTSTNLYNGFPNDCCPFLCRRSCFEPPVKAKQLWWVS